MVEYKMKRAMMTLTYRCNLNCNLCSAYVPLYKNKPHYSFDVLKKSIDRFFEVVTYVDSFTLTGGEPLLHDELNTIADYFTKFKDQIGQLTIITNGTLCPTLDLLEVLKDHSNLYKMLVDDYGPGISTKAAEIEQQLISYGIPYERRKYHGEDTYFNGWVDNWDLSFKLTTKEEIEHRFQSCATAQKMNFCFIIKNGQMHPCGPSYRCISEGIVDDTGTEYVDLLNEALNVEDLRNQIEDIYHVKYLSACAYCNGICADTKRHAPARQLTAEELAAVKELKGKL